MARPIMSSSILTPLALSTIAYVDSLVHCDSENCCAAHVRNTTILQIELVAAIGSFRGPAVAAGVTEAENQTSFARCPEASDLDPTSFELIFNAYSYLSSISAD